MFRWLRATLSLFLLVAWSVMGHAQENQIDFEAWQLVANRAENAVDANRASQEAFGLLREELAGWRARFQEGLDVNVSSLRRVNEQIAALGSPPPEGETEPADVAARRAALTLTQQQLLAPRRTAEEALSRANILIREIDDVLRQRFAEQILQMGPWPINPVHWPRALSDVQESLLTTVNAEWSVMSNPVRVAAARNKAPLVLGLFVVGLILVFRARRWSEWLAGRIHFKDSNAAARVVSFVVSLGQIFLPMAGVIAIIHAIGVADFLGPRGQLLVGILQAEAFAIFFAHWLGSRLYPKDRSQAAPLDVPIEERAKRRFYVFFLGVIYAIYIFVDAAAAFERYGAETKAVLLFVPILAAAVILLNFGRQIWQEAKVSLRDHPEDRVVSTKMSRLLGQAIMAVAVVSSLLGAFGFINAAQLGVFATLLTVALIGVVILLQGLARDIYAAIRSEEAARDGLLPVVLNMVIIVTALPVLALIWGARRSELIDVWERLSRGVTFGETTITPGSFLALIVIFALGVLATRGAKAALRISVLPKTTIDPGGQNAIVSGVGYIGITIAALVAVTAAGLDLSSLALVAGALSVGIGFGLQTIVSNFISGIILLVERPISEGDWIEVGGQMGHVRKIAVRSTRIETFDRTDVIVPNADLISNTVTNYTRGNTIGRVIIPVGVAYGTDTRRVQEILSEIANAHPMALVNPAPTILFVGFGADSLDFEIRMILRDIHWILAVKNDINHQIAARFAEEGIEIPFTQRDIWLRNPEVLPGAQSHDEMSRRDVDQEGTMQKADTEDTPIDPADAQNDKS